MPAEPDFLLSVYLRGGADGLSFVAPYDDPIYQAKRNQTRILPPGAGNPPREAIPLQAANGNAPAFGMPKALAPLESLYTDGRLLFVHAMGSTDSSRSHFVQQAMMERGITSESIPSESTGVWARHLASTPPVGSGALRGLAISGGLPKILKGGPAVTPTQDPSNYGFPGAAGTADVRRTALSQMYGAFGQPLREPFGNVLETIDVLEAIDWDGYQPGGGVTYPDSLFGLAMIQAAQIAKELPEVEVVHVDRGGWDTHAGQGNFGGQMYGNLQDLSLGLEAFLRDMETHSRKVVVVAVTEFGRTLDENSSAGTDHGRGGVALVAGDGAKGGQVVTDWPGLAPGQLDGGDLAVSIDVRDIWGEILLKRLNQPDLSQVFTDSNYTYTERGVIV